MTSTFRWYIAGLLALFGAYVALEYYRPKPLDWRPTLSNKDKIPYGTYVLYDQLPRLLGTDSVETIRLPIYNQLTGLPLAVTDAMAKAETVTMEADTVSEQAADDEVRENTTSSIPENETAAAKEPVADSTEVQAAADSMSSDSTAVAQSVEEPEEETEDDEASSTEQRLMSARANYLFVNTRFRVARPMRRPCCASLPTATMYSLWPRILAIPRQFSWIRWACAPVPLK
ncbi:hypothetical protein ACFQT0_11760 [Hymenobacter humi]|uniref:Uncharacterized protein n=1 Tax=Hymenobacter humi TaxID=1411620 RepID=A0ABW2U528_9BACT